jgi:hypothetical protein
MANQLSLDYIKENYDKYEDRMLAAWVGKPEKFWFYKNAFSKFDFNGMDKMKWVWSWWAFFGTFWYFLYRKAYVAAIVSFILLAVLGIIPFADFILAILIGGFGVYFVYKAYKKLKVEIEAVTQDEDERIKYMLERGGYNSWVIWVVIIVNVLLFIVMIALFSGGYASSYNNF